MIKHVTEIQSITSPILKAKFAKELESHIKTISELIEDAAKKGNVSIKMVLTEHTSNFYLDRVIPDYHSCDGYSINVPKFMQMKLSTALYNIFHQKGYHYMSYDEVYKGFNVKYIVISWSDGIISE